MDSAWLMAIGTGACNAGVALAGKGAERGRCRPAAYALIVFAVAGAVAFATTLGRPAAWGVGLLWVFGAVMASLYLVAIAAMVLLT